MVALTLKKKERISRRSLIEKLFTGGCSCSMSIFPLRAVYTFVDRDDEGVAVQILVSVSKRHFKRAVKRNRVKRQIRESFRLNKTILSDVVSGHEGKTLEIAFIWLADKLYSSEEIEIRMVALLHRINEKS